jgi:hypothetical protein
MIKSNRRALVRLATEKIVASTSDDFSALVRMGYAESLGLIVAPGVKRPRSLRAGYRITTAGAIKAANYNIDGSVKSIRC